MTVAPERRSTRLRHELEQAGDGAARFVAWQRLAEALHEEGAVEEAIGEAEALLRELTDPTDLRALTVRLRLAGWRRDGAAFGRTLELLREHGPAERVVELLVSRARDCLAAERWQEARARYEEALALAEGSLGAADMRTLAVRRELAYELMIHEEAQAAADHLDQVWRAHHQALGADHPLTLEALADRVEALRRADLTAQAWQALHGPMDELLTAAHDAGALPPEAGALLLLAAQLSCGEEVTEGAADHWRRWHRQAVASWRLAPAQQVSPAALERLAWDLSALDGVASQVEEIYGLAIERLRALDPESSGRAGVRLDQLRCLRRTGAHEAALQVGQELLEALEQRGQRQGVEALVTLRHMGSCAFDLDRLEQARALEEEALALAEVLGEEASPAAHRLSNLESLADTCEQQEDWARVVELRAEIVRRHRAAPLSDSPQALLLALEGLADALLEQERLEEAASHLEEVVGVLERSRLGPPWFRWPVAVAAQLVCRAARDGAEVGATDAHRFDRRLEQIWALAEERWQQACEQDGAWAEVAAARDDLAWMLYKGGLSGLAARAQRRALQTLEERAEAGAAADRLEARWRLGLYLRRAQDWEAAAPVCQQLFEEMSAQLGPGAPRTLKAARELASCLFDGGDIEAAVRIEERALEQAELHLGPRHEETVQLRGELASSLHRLGDHQREAALREELWQHQREERGDGHPGTLRALENWIYALERSGARDEAHQRTEELLGMLVEADAPREAFIYPLNTLGRLERAAGDREAAREAYQDALLLARRSWGAESFGALAIEANALMLASELGDQREAATRLPLIAARYEEAHGPGSLGRLRVLAGLALVHHRLGDHGRELQLGELIASAQEEARGPRHPYTLAALSDLAHTCREVGDLQRARALFSRVVDGRLETLGPVAEATQLEAGQLARTMAVDGDEAEARGLLEEMLALVERRAPGTAAAGLPLMQALAAVLRIGGQIDEADELDARIAALKDDEAA